MNYSYPVRVSFSGDYWEFTSPDYPAFLHRCNSVVEGFDRALDKFLGHVGKIGVRKPKGYGGDFYVGFSAEVVCAAGIESGVGKAA